MASKPLIYSYHNLLITTSSALQFGEKTNLIEHFFDIDLTCAGDTIGEMVATLQVDIFLLRDNLV